MKQRLYHIVTAVSVTLLLGVLPSSCIYDDGDTPEQQSGTIRVNTLAVNGTRAASTEDGDNTFMVLFWEQEDLSNLESPSENAWNAPYLASCAPQPVAFYSQSVYDTRYPYPDESSKLYATGYAPGKVLAPDKTEGYRKLTATVSNLEKGRYDFLGCDVWSDVYKGSQSDPFAQEKNKLYFRHLAAKLVFYADRDKTTMENKQYVRNVEITNLQMSIDNGKTWRSMYTPKVFEWKLLGDGDFTDSYKKTIEAAKQIVGNTGVTVTSQPAAGYKTTGTEPFAGAGNTDFKLSRHATDRVPVSGMYIDSLFVCNPITDGEIQSAANSICLKMDISAELSFHPDFPLSGDDKESTTDDLTFTRTWENVTLSAIYGFKQDAEGKLTIDNNNSVKLFKPGNEYRVYIHFYRTGVNLTAMEMPWNYGGVHYITIAGGDKQQDETNETNK